MWKRKITILLTVLFLCNVVFASTTTAPPEIPMVLFGEVTDEGNPVADGVVVTAEIDGIDYAQSATTANGQYNVIVAGSDSPLTDANDPDCTEHDANGEACIPCDTNIAGDCVEGPQDGDVIILKLNNNKAMPYVDLVGGNTENIDIVTPLGDWDKSGCVEAVDYIYFIDQFSTVCSTMSYDICDNFDLYRDHTINTFDFTIFIDYFNQGNCGG